MSGTKTVVNLNTAQAHRSAYAKLEQKTITEIDNMDKVTITIQIGSFKAHSCSAVFDLEDGKLPLDVRMQMQNKIVDMMTGQSGEIEYGEKRSWADDLYATWNNPEPTIAPGRAYRAENIRSGSRLQGGIDVIPGDGAGTSDGREIEIERQEEQPGHTHFEVTYTGMQEQVNRELDRLAGAATDSEIAQPRAWSMTTSMARAQSELDAASRSHDLARMSAAARTLARLTINEE